MSVRDDNRGWLAEGQTRDPNGWEAGVIDSYGMEGALDLLACQGHRPHDTNMTHRPFSHDEELKELVYAAREATRRLANAAHNVWWVDLDEWRNHRKVELDGIDD